MNRSVNKCQPSPVTRQRGEAAGRANISVSTQGWVWLRVCMSCDLSTSLFRVRFSFLLPSPCPHSTCLKPSVTRKMNIREKKKNFPTRNTGPHPHGLFRLAHASKIAFGIFFFFSFLHDPGPDANHTIVIHLLRDFHRMSPLLTLLLCCFTRPSTWHWGQD